MFFGKNILVLAPHTDDGEIGCGGTLAKSIEGGSKVTYLAFSTAEDSLPAGYPRDTLSNELRAATAVLGLESEAVVTLDYTVRRFFERRQDILDDMIQFRNKLNPDVVFMPSLDDCHQDHSVVAQEGFRAFKNITILSYEVPWNNRNFTNTFYSVISEEQLELKIKAIGCYQSQQHRRYTSAEFTRSLACVRGTQVQQKYAELFEVVRCVSI